VIQFIHISAFVCNEKHADLHCQSLEWENNVAIHGAVDDNDTIDDAD
jgi:hypothetical protein